MPALEPLNRLLKFDLRKISKEEQMILEAELFSRICIELKNHFRKQHLNYFRLMKFTTIMENDMLEANFTKMLIKDILLSKQYTIEGLAHYTGVHEDILHEVITGKNVTPSAYLLQRTIDLHRTVRSELYESIIKKILLEYHMQ